MHTLRCGPEGRGTVLETFCKLLDVAGLVITVRSPLELGETVGAIVKVAPRLSESHEVRPDGLVISRIGMFVVYWAVFKSPGGSLAMLAPNSGYEKQDRLDWIGHFREGILDPVRSLSSLGFTVDLGSQGEVADPVFAQEFLHASIE